MDCHSTEYARVPLHLVDEVEVEVEEPAEKLLDGQVVGAGALAPDKTEDLVGKDPEFVLDLAMGQIYNYES